MGNMISGLACSLNSGPSQACSLGGALNIRQLAVITSLEQNQTASVLTGIQRIFVVSGQNRKLCWVQSQHIFKPDLLINADALRDYNLRSNGS